ncbi:MAG: hypothetical protein WAM82_05900 [Thermoanaerobaculia bacterium]
MTREEEKYVHFASSIVDLNYAWRILREIKGASDSVLVGAAFQFALVAYSRPYKESRGSLRRYRLGTKFIPIEHRGLHQRILDARDKIHAHSDLTVKEAQLHVAMTMSGKFVGAVQNVITGLEELVNIDLILALIEQTFDRMYEEAKRLEACLPVNS